MRKVLVGLAGFVIVMPVMAQAMTVAEFLSKADALKANPLLAMTSSDLTLLRKEIATASDAYRGAIDKQVAVGKRPSSCPPPKGAAKIGSDDIIAEFRKIPVAKGGKTSVNAAFAAFMTRRYPCKA